MKKKKLGMLLLFLQFSVLNLWATSEKALIVELQNGSKTEFLLSGKPELTFANRVLQIAVKGSISSFEIGNVKQFYFDDASTGIESIASNGLRIVSKDDNLIIIEGIDGDDKISLYSLNGEMMSIQPEISGNRAEVPLVSLPQGIYLIKISNKQTFKIYRK
ncbi:MAG: T9SS type A sorting domain-containing protein [Bacteroidaceae bacterium]|nr:T9SS type A sorting domain-containing protein [Bacteroidaceae bacterium]